MPGTPQNNSPDAPPASLFGGRLPIEAALNELRLRLLDLTGRNRLINFKHTAGKSLQFVHTSLDATFRRLLADQSSRVGITPLPEPDRAAWVMRGGRLGRPEPRDYAATIGIDPSYELFGRQGRAVAAPTSGSQARTLFYAEDLGKHCRKLEREARSAIEETGANMLYLVFGMLEFPEAPDSDKLYRAPLVCVPVSMTRTDEGQYSSFHLAYTGEELSDNLSLREKVRRDFGLNLPDFDIDEDGSLENYLEAITDRVSTLPGWSVRRMLTLTLLSFTNMLLVRDLDPGNWPRAGQSSALLAHPLVKQVFEGQAVEGDARYGDEYDIDTHPKGDLPLIYDADSSQHSALIDVHEGRNRVIEGPPGTGKSQTITNLIAAALQSGKKVLFVAEKLAALEVVKSRLTLAGLAPFVLELHSHKTTKKRVLEDLATRVALRPSGAGDLLGLLERQASKRKELKAYADLMNAKAGSPLDLTLHQVMWRAERNRLKAGDSAAVVQQLAYLPASRTTPSQLAALLDRLRYVAAQLELIGTYGPGHSLWGFFPAEFKPEDDIPVQRALSVFAARFEAFADAMAKAAALLGGTSLNMGDKSAAQLLSVLANIAPADPDRVAFGLLPALFADDDPRGVRSLSVLQDLSTRIAALEAAEAEVLRHTTLASPATDAQAAAAAAALKDLKTHGLGALTASQLEAQRKQLRKATDDAEGALGVLADAAKELGVPFDGTAGAAGQLVAIVDAAANAPKDGLHLLHPGLRGPEVVSDLQRAKARLQAQQERFESMERMLYMDALPSDDALSAAILTLREGDAWYRFFQSRWRGAVRVHQQLQRQKSKLSAAQRLRDLEQIRQLLKDQAAWRDDPVLRAATGPHFKAEQSPLDPMLALATWVRETDAAMEAVGVLVGVFDATTLDRARLLAVQQRAPAIRGALAALNAFDGICQGALASAYAVVRKGLSGVDWKGRLAAADGALRAISAAQLAMKGMLRREAPAEAVLHAVVTSHEIPALEQALAEHPGGRALFGKAYDGRRTDVEAALAAHTYGALVLKSSLPGSIEKALLLPDCMTSHGLLSAYTRTIADGWQAVSEFGAAMSGFGRFEPATWADPSVGPASQYAQALATKTRLAADTVGGLLAWAQYVGARKEAVNAGLEDFITRHESGQIPAEKLEAAFLYRFYASIAQAAFEKSPALRQFSGLRHASVRQEFAHTDKEIIKLRGQQVAQDCCAHSKPPAGNVGIRVEDKTEMELLRHLMPQQRPRVAVRQMLRRAGQAIQELKPCFMMGPQAVAQFLEPGQLHFDIVVMDEASQLRPEEAIGAIARGSQLVVVGDPKQLPPTSFFSRMNPTEDDGGEDAIGPLTTTDAESILDVCSSHFHPVRTLRWHYRSRHESLIAFSNHHFYRGKLVVFPSPYPQGRALGLRCQHVPDGVYESQMNPVEARRVVDAAVEHILHRPDDSLGLVTLNIKQRDLVAELLDERLRGIPEAVRFKERWEAEGMGLFIKNLENVQGDERDCIFISTTFGKPKGSNVVRQNFGPISRQGGWRRLNVLFTRARKSVAVFTSMKPEDIVIDGKTPEGTRALRHYLEYASRGAIPADAQAEGPPQSEFATAVMDVLRGQGYEVESQLGVAGFRIEVGVRHPTNRAVFLAAIECDGQAYHSGVSVRDRDRIRQEVLENLGWRDRIWRIWSTDWFRNPAAETERLLQFLEKLKALPIPVQFAPVEANVVNEPVPAAPALPPEDTVTAEERVFVEDTDELEVEIGDLVTYAPASALDQPVRARLTPRLTNPSLGLVAETTPLGSVLLGATVGDTVVLRVPGMAPQPFVIQAIKRSEEGGAGSVA